MTATIWFMGRPASGKSTLAKQVEERLRDAGLAVENLDGDEVRKNLHPDLGFTREERALNNRRTAFVCRLLNRNDIMAVTAMITPFRDAQERARRIVEEDAQFVLVYVKCPLEVAAERDPKGLYERAQAGKIENFTGVNHPFQEPVNPDIVVDTAESSVDECVTHVFARLDELGVFEDDRLDGYTFDISRREEAEILDRLDDRGYFDPDDE
jgi:adenylyl-sulfate kinase